MIKPWWHTPLWVLVGVGWWLLLMLPGWFRHPRAPEQRYVAAVYTALAADLRADPNDAVGPSRQGLAAALNSGLRGRFESAGRRERPVRAPPRAGDAPRPGPAHRRHARGAPLRERAAASWRPRRKLKRSPRQS